ncbi:MAG: hypothetical protein M1118_00170 [Chloroflexi bacterium]|nr:hypothetical protein [Chloroflexota bacterium]
MQESSVLYQLVLEEADVTELVHASFGERPLSGSVRQLFATHERARAGEVAASLGCQSAQGLPL